jgi:DHA1 family bicyclomycin/chloramphenicol resistance-like MFS transporter
MTIGALCTYMVGFGGDPALAAAMVVTAAAMLGQVGFWIGIGKERGRRRVNDTQRT